jgi:hypothetical protein
MHSDCVAARPSISAPLHQPWDSLRFHGFPLLGDASTLQSLRSAVSDSGREPVRQQRISAGFYAQLIDEDAYLFNYTDNSASNFLGRGDVVRRGHDLPVGEVLRAEDKARFRREYRGLVVHRSGAVLARPMHKFFSIDQVHESHTYTVNDLEIESVTVKLDGQMVYGVTISNEVQFWTRSGPTEVGIEAYRVALCDAADYLGFVRFVSSQQCTAVFEFIGRRSLKKAFEGHHNRLVLLAVRHHSSGIYWRYAEMEHIARRFGVEVVERFPHLEQLGDGEGNSITEIKGQVKNWHNCEGVVIRFTNQSWVKVKSDWWQRTGYSSQFSVKIAAGVTSEQRKLQARKEKLQHFSLRLAVLGLRFDTRPVEVMDWFPGCKQVQMVYGHSGRLRLAIVVFSTQSERNEALWDPLNSALQLQPAYSSRTRTGARHRVDTFYHVACPPRG